ncbi:MAG: heme ABC transporter ATP-binding protein [Pseudomonadota bacterium]
MKVTTRNVEVQYGRKRVLDALDFDAEAGQLTAIVGPNGSGKSTLLKAICGDLPYSGSVTLNDFEVAKTPAWQMAALRGVLPQASNLAFPFTALEVVRIGLSTGTGAKQHAQATAALDRVGLYKYAEQLYQELSGGEQQRVQLARVLAQVWQPVKDDVPRWLILDEPVSSLDVAHQLEVMRLARDFSRAGGGVIAVMHDLNLTGLFSDKVVVLSEGQALAAGPTYKVMTDDVLSQAYACDLRVNAVPNGPAPFVLPHLTAYAAGAVN